MTSRKIFSWCLFAILVGNDFGQLMAKFDFKDRSEPTTRPNVLFISVDDLRPELNCYGQTQIESPNIDRFAASGLLFQNAYCQQAVCNPSRTSLMTGLRPDTIGVTGNHSHFRSNHPDVVTLPQHFKNHGYHAQGIGKIYHGVFPDGASITKWDTMGDPQSWSVPATRFGPRYYYTEEGIAAARKVYHQIYKPENPGPDDWTEKLVFGPATESPDVPDETLYDGQVASAAVKALRKLGHQSDKPFFLAVGFIKPHSPYVAPKKYFDRYTDIAIAQDQNLPTGAPRFSGHSSGELRRYTDQPRQGKVSDTNQRRVRHAYYACVSYIDAQIGRVLDELDELGMANNTIVALYGDHGYHLGEQGLWGKTTNFELDTRVPLIVRAPGMKAAGEQTSSIVELVDLYPTLAHLAGLPVQPSLEGVSFAEMLDNPKAITKSVALSQYPRSKGLMGYSMRTPTHRLTQWIHRKSGEIRASELYEYQGARLESKNVAANPANRSLVDDLSGKLLDAFGLESVETSNHPTGQTESFETASPGRLTSYDSALGTWSSPKGDVRIDNRHAKNGKQCLHLAGGENSSIELDLAKGVATDGQLTFWAERWTSRSPFSFRIEKQVGSEWTEIYNGDKQVKVGREFLSNVIVALGDPNIRKLRFSVTSPANTGILIDDIRLAPARPQRITSVEVVPMTLPALVGTPASALVKLRVDVEGLLDPISLTEIKTTLSATTDLKDVDSLHCFSSGANPNFSAAVEFGKSTSGNPLATGKPTLFTGDQPLSEGKNHFWIACKLSEQANIDHFVGAVCHEARFSNQKTYSFDQRASKQRMGVAVRKRGDDGVHTFRIPGLATTNRGTLIGVYDVRRRGGRDLPGDIDVGMSRSTDGGRTWEPMKTIIDMGDNPQFRYDGVGDPAILVDKQTGTIWVAGIWSHGDRGWHGSQPGLKPEQTGQFILVKSDDDGVTWSNPINITEQVKNPAWSFLLQGPGKGISLSDGTIVFPAQYQDPPNSNDRRANRLPHSTFIYSRDHGVTWHVATGAFDDTTEAQIIETVDGELMINCRYNRQSKRIVMTTRDMGKSWQEHPTSRKTLNEPGACMASLINVDRELGLPNPSRLLFSNPNNPRERSQITIKASTDLGASWPNHHQLMLDEQRGSGYSCMTMIDESTVGILYEGSQAHMTFQRIPLADIFDANPAPSKKLSFHRVFGDHMVLQANQPIRVWGSTAPMTCVQLTFGQQTDQAQSDDEGNWFIELDSMPSNANPQTLTAHSAGQTVSVKDVLVGEVWFCAGQSNMEWPLMRSAGAKNALQKSDDPLLRLYNCRGVALGRSGVYDQHMLDHLAPDRYSRGIWKMSHPESAQSFSAVAFYFAEQLREKLQCPVGMINVSAGGTPIESWLSIPTLRTHSELAKMLNGNWLENPVLDRWCQTRARQNLKQGLAGSLIMESDQLGPSHAFKPGFMFESSVNPFLPLSIRGVLWYQGESNAESRQRVSQYDAAFPLLVSSWRSGFQNEAMPVVFVQLPAMGRHHWPIFREQQRRSLDQLKNVGMAITIDTGHPTNVHPSAKQPVGHRLAHWALVKTYGHTDLGPATGPIFSSSSVSTNQMAIEFTSVGDGLKIKGDSLFHFELAGADGKFYAAQAKLTNVPNRLVLSSDFVPHPVHARYAWKPFPDPPANLYNSAGLPASPFTTEEDF